jgi:pimeloyl-ACP methyl ester carboxylesterase
MSVGVSPFRSAQGEAQYLAAYDASIGLWPVPYKSIDVTTHYGRTHINACGSQDAFPAILLHGGYASSAMWFPNVADPSSRFRVLALDTMGEPGKSIPSQCNATRQDAGHMPSMEQPELVDERILRFLAGHKGSES